MPKDGILTLYRRRHARLAKRGLTRVEGLEETIHSLAEHNCDRVWLIIVRPEDDRRTIISVLLDRDDCPIGCVIGVWAGHQDLQSSA